MRVWVVCDHEPLPIDPGNRQLMRAGMLTQALAEAGHETTWFTSSFDHYRKRQRGPSDTTVRVTPNLSLRVLATPGYRRNVDIARVVHNIAFAHAFNRNAALAEPPDVIVAPIPTTEAAAAAVRFAITRGIPSVVDIRDPWPDSFRSLLPRSTLIMATPLTALLDTQARFACAHATSLIGTTRSYLRWGQAKGGRGASAAFDATFPLGFMPRPLADTGRRTALLGRLGLEAGRRIVSFVGSWGVSHDFSLVAGAAEQLQQRSDIRFVIAGDADSQPTMQARLGKLHNLVLPGWLSADDAGTLLAASDIGLLPYRRGASQEMPNKFFEYMAYGAYQIATMAGEAARLYEATGTGRSVACSGDAIAEAIRDHLARPEGADERELRIAVFQRRFAGTALYASMVRHIEDIAAAGASPNAGRTHARSL